MRFHVDAWDPSYGSPVEGLEAVPESTARVSPDVELLADDWRAVDPTHVPAPGAVIFIDGVRRTEARLWIDQEPTLDPSTGELSPVASIMGLSASYAAGAVCCCPAGAHVLAVEARRGLFTTASNAADVTTSAGIYRVHLTAEDPGQSPAVVLSAALQRRLGDLEMGLSVGVREGLAVHDVAEGTDLLVVDGPLRGRVTLPRALGFIKTHRSTYLPPPLNNLVATLTASQRTPVFLMGTSWDRHSWYLRLPCRPGHAWAGIVRVECSADIPAAEAVALANTSQSVLCGFASTEYKDPRAPQNLVPIAGLEREMRRRLGDPAILSRALRIAASSAA